MGLGALALWLVAVGAIALFFAVPKTRVWLAAAATLTLVLGVASYKLHRSDVHLTACGFNDEGAYAKVRVDNWLGLSADKRLVSVSFAVKGGPPLEAGGYGDAGKTLEAPSLGHVTATMQGRFPPRGSSTSPVRQDPYGHSLPRQGTIAGRTVYRYVDQGQSRLVSREFAHQHSGLGVIRVETVPADHSLQCSVSVSENSEQD